MRDPGPIGFLQAPQETDISIPVKRNSPLQQLEEIEAFLFPYLIIGPLLSALFAERIDNFFVGCLLFVVVVGSAFSWIRRRFLVLQDLIREQENRLRELEKGESDDDGEEKNGLGY